MRPAITFLLCFAVCVAAAVVAVPYLHPAPVSVTVQSQGPTIERLERLSQLVTTRVSVADVLVGEGEGIRPR
jgi:hypothetical protein